MFLEKIFSIKYSAFHISITLFGIKLNIRTNFHANQKIYDYAIEKNKIFIYSSTNSYACNPKYIVEEIISRNLPYEIVWGVHVQDNIASIPDKIKVVTIDSEEYLKEFASAKILICNMRTVKELNRGLIKKQGQIYIQTWHGSLGIKKLGSEINHLKGKVIPSTKIDAESIDYLISNSDFEDKIYKKTFWGNGEILKIGHPRNDIFFKNSSCIKEKVFKTYNIAPENKVVLYAPTFRDKEYNTDVYDLDTELLRQALSKKFGGRWVVLMRLHPQFIVTGRKFNFQNDPSSIDVTSYPDMQELLLSSDAVITDYSSCIFDFMLSRRPGFIYATDIEKYNTNRGFYYPLESTPFPIAKNNEDMVANIENFDNDKYKEQVEQFLQEKGCIDKGDASKCVVDLIEKIVDGAADQ